MNRPTSVTVFGILNIIFGAFGILGLMMSAAMLFGAQADMRNPVNRILAQNPTLALWTKASLILGGASSVVLLVCGIGLLQLRPWARIISIVYSVYGIVMTIVGLAINFLFLFGPLMEEAQRTQGPQAAAAVGGAIGGLVGGCAGWIYPVLLLVFMLRPNVVAAFKEDETLEGPFWQ